MTAQIPIDASYATRQAIQALNDEIRRLNNKVAKLEPSSNLDEFRDIWKALAKIAKKPTYRTWEEVFGAFEPSANLVKRIATPVIGPVIAADIYRGPLQDKGGAIFDVKAYGATGDGATDDSGAFQAAIDAASITSVLGGMVYVPPGTYKISTALVVTARVSFLGAGSQTSRLFTPNATQDLLTFSLNCALDSRALSIDGLEFTTGVTRTGGTYLKMVATNAMNSGVIIRNCRFTQGFVCILMQDQSLSVIEDNIITCVANGICIKYTNVVGSADGGDNGLINNTFLDGSTGGQYGLFCDRGQAGLRVVSNKFLGTFSSAIRCTNNNGDVGADLRILGNSIEAWTSNGILIDPSGTISNILIQNNDIAPSVGGGPYKYINVAPTATGIVDTLLIQGNGLYSSGANTTTGIHLNPGAAGGVVRTIIDNNLIQQMTTGILIAANTGAGRATGNHFPLCTTSITNSATALFAPHSISATRNSATVVGPGGAGQFEMTTEQTDADGIRLGLLNFCDRNSTSGSKLVAALAAALEGTTGNNRGSRLEIFTKINNGAFTERVRIDSNGSVMLAMAGALGTTATDGFTYIPTCAGAPTGVPTAKTGMVAMIYDTTNNNFYVYNGAWKKVLLA